MFKLFDCKQFGNYPAHKVTETFAEYTPTLIMELPMSNERISAAEYRAIRPGKETAAGGETLIMKNAYIQPLPPPRDRRILGRPLQNGNGTTKKTASASRSSPHSDNPRVSVEGLTPAWNQNTLRTTTRCRTGRVPSRMTFRYPFKWLLPVPPAANRR